MSQKVIKPIITQKIKKMYLYVATKQIKCFKYKILLNK